MDQKGETTPLRATPVNWSTSFAPDGRQSAMQIADPTIRHLVHEWARDTSLADVRPSL
jgi:hypothetical protein